MLGIGGVFFDGVPDAVDVDGDGGCIAEGFHAPDAVVDGFPAENDIRVNHKKFKQLEFFVGKQFVSPRTVTMRVDEFKVISPIVMMPVFSFAVPFRRS